MVSLNIRYRWQQPEEWPEGLALCADFLPDHQKYFQQLRDEIDWQQRQIQIFGRQIDQPRLVAWHGDPEANYRYSGLQLSPRAWTPSLLELKKRVEGSVNVRFNSVLLNLYRNGSEHMGWHCDNEPELGEDPTIASLSLGESRCFRLRRGRSGRSLGFDLQGGSLLLMAGSLQSEYQHSLSKTARPASARINLTFRWVQPSA